MSEPVIKRVARYADGWFPQLRPGDPGARETMDRLQGYIAEAGRRPEDIGIEGRLQLTGSPEDWAQTLDDWRDLGASHLTVNTMDTGTTSPRDHIEAIRRFKQAIPQVA
jgi:alkanesulfonate monooxygenase SsuD/methylene tetrahydromethanopterin reductase-like flavin-dependent oxidoreductase (luciferase family)